MSLRFLGSALLVAAVGCTGEIMDGGHTVASHDGNGGAAGSVSTGGTGGTGTMGGGGTDGVANIEPPSKGMPSKVCGTYPTAKAGPGPAPLRRLTRTEYNNTVFDLLGDPSKPGSQFPDDARDPRGFDNQAEILQVTGQLAGDFFEAAQTLAARAIADPKVTPACAAGGEETCAQTFIATFGKKAFRRPVPATSAASLMALYRAGRSAGDNHAVAMTSMVTAMLQSPYFIYRPEFGGAGGRGLTSWEMASRLSYLVWGTMPDASLFAAADADALKQPDQIKAQVDRMLPNAKTRPLVADFHRQVLNLDRVDALARDAKIYPNFAAVRDSMKEETTRFMERAYWQGDGAVAGLFSATTSFMTPDLDKFINKRTTSTLKPGFQVVTLDPTQRIGILTHASLLSSYSKGNETLPPARGKFIADRILCATFPDPPADVPNNVPTPESRPDLTTRERFEIHGQQSCARSCHGLLDPMGYAFENFDPAGRWRAQEGGKMVDASGVLSSTISGGGQDAAFPGAVGFSKLVAESSEAKKCIAKSWMQFALGRPLVQQDERSLEQLYCSFEKSAFNMRELLAAIALTDSFGDRQEVTP